MGSKKHKKESKKKKHRSRSRSPLDGEERERKRHKKHKDRKKDRSPDVEEVPVDSHLAGAGDNGDAAEPSRSRSASAERERERDRRAREAHRAHKDEREKSREVERVKEPSPVTSSNGDGGGGSSSGGGGGGAGGSLSVEETNRLRAKLGLKPLEVAEKPADDGKFKDDLGEFYHKPASNITEQKKSEKLRERLDERREKRKMEQKLKTTLLAEEEQDEDALAWVKKSREIEKAKREAAKRAAMLDEMDEVFGVSALLGAEQLQERHRAYGAADLQGLRVQHDIDALGDERDVVLTLADKDVLAEDKEDVLVNVNIVDDERYKKNILERKKAAHGYKAYDDEAELEAAALGFSRPVLGKYDEEINPAAGRSRGFVIGSDAALEAKRSSDLMRQARQGGGPDRRLESLQTPQLRLASDYLDEHEISAKFKKTKRRGKIRKKAKAEPIDVEDYEAGTAPLETDDTEVKPSQMTVELAVDEEETEPDMELQTALARARRLRQARDLQPAVPKVEEILERVKEEDPPSEAVEGGGMVLDATAEFCRTLGDTPSYGQAGNRDVIARAIAEEQEEAEMEVEPEAEAGGGAWARVDVRSERPADIAAGSSVGLEAEPALGAGVAGALRLALSKGYLERTGPAPNTRGNLSSLLAARNYSIEDKAIGVTRVIMPGAVKRRANCAYSMIVEGERMEQPLHPKKARVWQPKNCGADVPRLPCELSTSSAGAILVASKPTGSNESSHEQEAPPSPILFCEVRPTSTSTPEVLERPRPVVGALKDQENSLEMSPSVSPSSSRKSTRSSKSPKKPLGRRLLSEFQKSDLLHMGSDDDDDADDTDNYMCNRFDTCVVGRQIPLDSTYDEDIMPEPDISAPVPSSSSNDEQGDLPEFIWRPFPENAIPPTERRESFTEVTGPVRKFTTPYEAFVAIWDDDIMDHIVAETNRYACQVAEEKLANATMGHSSRITQWVDTTKDELYLYFGMLMAMSMCIKGQIGAYWGESGKVSDTPNFSKYMSYNRFILLNKCLHFRDNVEIANLIADNQLSVAEMRTAKIEPIVGHLNKKFQALYSLSQNIVIDESLVQWKGWLQIKQFIKNKAASVGIKSYELCDSLNGYLWRFELCTGVDHSVPVQGAGTSPLESKINKLVLRMLQGLESTHRTVWMDNYYNSPMLARHLKSLGLDCAGTLRTNRQFVPEDLKHLDKGNMLPGEIVGCTSGDVDVMVWRDKNRVAMISTYHGIAVSTSAKKPVVVLDYNVRMGGVDRKDQLLSQYPLERKRTSVWYKKMFRRLLNASVTNAYILMSESGNIVNTQHRKFRETLRDSLLSRHSPTQSPASIVPLRVAVVTSAKKTTPRAVFGAEMVRHFPKQFAKVSDKGGLQRRTCIVCHTRTKTYCPGCDVPLCTFAKTDDQNSCFVVHHLAAK